MELDRRAYQASINKAETCNEIWYRYDSNTGSSMIMHLDKPSLPQTQIHAAFNGIREVLPSIDESHRI
jgi:hypothetical protein